MKAVINNWGVREFWLYAQVPTRLAKLIITKITPIMGIPDEGGLIDLLRTVKGVGTWTAQKIIRGAGIQVISMEQRSTVRQAKVWARVVLEKLVAQRQMLEVQLSEVTAAPPPTGETGSKDECVVCMDRPRSIVLIPCGHRCLCDAAACRLLTCPVCRVDVQLSTRIYNP
tara:strand:+ start:297 stop:806 length:510 start_codon:yes stop_codon:yes gene_type:complete